MGKYSLIAILVGLCFAAPAEAACRWSPLILKRDKTQHASHGTAGGLTVMILDDAQGKPVTNDAQVFHKDSMCEVMSGIINPTDKIFVDAKSYTFMVNNPQAHTLTFYSGLDCEKRATPDISNESVKLVRGKLILTTVTNCRKNCGATRTLMLNESCLPE